MEMPVLDKELELVEEAKDEISCVGVFYECPKEEAKWIVICTFCSRFFPIGNHCKGLMDIADKLATHKIAQCAVCGGSKKRLADLFSIFPI